MAKHHKTQLMKKLSYFTFACAVILGLVSCGGGKEKIGEEEIPEASNPFEAIANMGKAMEKGANALQEKIKERQAKGDTLAMPYEELMKYLPGSIDGYTKGKTDGATVNMMGASYSNANVTFENDKNERIKIQLVDYNAAYSMYSTLTAMWAMGMSIDTPDEKANGVKLEGDIGGWEVYKKKSKDVNLTLGIGYRFWLNIEADNQDNTDFVKSIAKSMDLDKLSGL